MKLVDILARELKVWPEGCKAITQDSDGYVVSAKDVDVDSLYFDHNAWSGEGGPYMEIHELASDHKTAIVTRAEWKAAVDALNAPNVVEWDGVGLPPVGTVCEVLWNESRVEYLRTKVFGVNEHGQPIHRFDEGPKKYQYQADVLRTASGTQVFRPIRTAEQVAAEEIEAIREFLIYEHRDGGLIGIAKALHESGYRKEPKPCGS